MTDFKDLGLSATTLKAVADTGYTTATPIQEQAIPVALAGRDVLGIAQTGTGKTAAFTLPLIDRLGSGRARARMPRALVLAPTRELADQVAASFEKYAKGTRLQWALLIGGVSMGDQLAALDKGVDVLIATPGRLIDLFERSKVLLTGVQIMVIDEADRMLDMGFIPDIERIFKMTPPKRQTLFFSATMPPEITRLTAQFLKDPTRIEVARPATTADTITQYLVRLPMSDPKAKRTALRALVGRDDVKNGIVFCNRKSEVDIVAKSLSVHGFDAAPIHGDLEQSMRTRTLDNFRKGDLKFLVASDVAARGLDIPDVSHVFNYDVPHHADDYVHRIGRTGRAGKSGQTFMIVTPADDKSLDKVLKLTGKAPNELTLDLDWAEIKVGADRDKARRSESDRKGGGRDRGGSRSGGGGRDRDRSRGRPATETSTVGMEAIDQSDLPEATAAPAVRPERKERPARAEQTEATASAKPERARRSRKPRNESPAEDISAAAVVEAAPVAVAEPEVREAPARRERDRDRERRPEPAREASRDRGERNDRSDRDRGGRRDRDDDGGPRVIGFGNDLPAFMTRVPPQIARNED